MTVEQGLPHGPSKGQPKGLYLCVMDGFSLVTTDGSDLTPRARLARPVAEPEAAAVPVPAE